MSKAREAARALAKKQVGGQDSKDWAEMPIAEYEEVINQTFLAGARWMLEQAERLSDNGDYYVNGYAQYADLEELFKENE
jgi:hypothetical protein